MTTLIEILGTLTLMAISVICAVFFIVWICSWAEKQWDRTCNFTHYIIYKDEFKYWFKHERRNHEI